VTATRDAEIIRRRATNELKRRISEEPRRKTQLVRETAEYFGVSPATVWRWLTSDPSPRGRPRGSKLIVFDDRMKGLLYQSGNNVAEFLRRAVAAGLFAEARPSLATIRRAVARDVPRVERVLARYGDRGVRDHALVYLPMNTLYRAHAYMMDHCQLPWYVIAPWPMRGLIQPWFTAVIDACTRVIVGFVISVHPNSTTIALALAAAICADGRGRFHGIPENVLIDNGSDFLSKHIEEAMMTIGTVITPHIGYHPNVKGIVERVNWTVQLRMQGFPGFADGPKTVDKKRQFTQEDGWVAYSDVYGAMATLIDAYHEDEHTSLSCSPAEAWDRDPTPLVTIDSPEKTALLLMKSGSLTIQKDGIHLAGRTYASEETICRKGDRVTVRYWPHDQRKVYVFDNAGKVFIGVASNTSEMTSDEKVAIWQSRQEQLRAANREVRRAKRAARPTFEPTTEAGKDPEVVYVRPGRRDRKLPRVDSSASVRALAFPGVDESFSVEG
jgi:putative transposase